MKILISSTILKETQISSSFDVVLRTFEAARYFLFHSFPGLMSEVYIDYNIGGTVKETGLEILKIGLENKLLPENVWVVPSSVTADNKMAALLRSFSYCSFNSDNKWTKQKYKH